MVKERLDLLVVERRLVESRTKAQWLIKSGYVLVNGIKVRKPGKKIDNSLDIYLKKEFPYVGRGGLKLEAALERFSISVKGKVCADIGASIGGFTDCLLKHGASRVYAIDIAEDLLHPSLRCEKMKNRVILLLGVDARELNSLGEKVDICTIDVTFASLRVILPNVKKFLKISGEIVALVKPLFETEYYKEKKFGVIQDSKVLIKLLIELMDWCVDEKFFPYGIIKSPLLGKGGSIEFIVYFKIDNTNFYLDYKNTIRDIL